MWVWDNFNEIGLFSNLGWKTLELGAVAATLHRGSIGQAITDWPAPQRFLAKQIQQVCANQSCDLCT